MCLGGGGGGGETLFSVHLDQIILNSVQQFQEIFFSFSKLQKANYPLFVLLNSDLFCQISILTTGF